jgi:hypothetical protein
VGHRFFGCITSDRVRLGLSEVPKRGRGDPGDAKSRATTQHQRELAGVMRYVAQIQEQQLADAHVVPWKSASLCRAL